jgi:hypothetical protein
VIDHHVIKLGWDAMIAFPDCTFLTVSANRWANEPWRMEARHLALQFVKTLWALPIRRKAIENPVGVLPTMWRRPTQSVQPWQFWHLDEPGKGEVKQTCLWLDGFAPCGGWDRALPAKPTAPVPIPALRTLWRGSGPFHSQDSLLGPERCLLTCTDSIRILGSTVRRQICDT